MTKTPTNDFGDIVGHHLSGNDQFVVLDTCDLPESLPRMVDGGGLPLV